MTVDAKISILAGRECTTIEIKDSKAGITPVRIKLTPEQLSRALSREMHVECEECSFVGLDNIGKKMVVDRVSIPTPFKERYGKDEAILDVVNEYIENNMPEWKADQYLGSQDSITRKDDIVYANVIIRKWVSIPTGGIEDDSQRNC